MNTFTTKALVRKYPFIKELMKENTDIRIVESFNWDYIPKWNSRDGSMGYSNFKEQIHFVIFAGNIRKDAVTQEEEHASNYAHTPTHRHRGESILEALDRQNLVKLQAVITETHDKSSWEQDYNHDEHALTIYFAKPDEVARHLNDARAQAETIVASL